MLVQKQTPRLMCKVGSGMLSLSKNITDLPDFVDYFPVSVHASMRACAVWFQPSVPGLGSV